MRRVISALLVAVPALITLTTGVASEVVAALPPGFIDQPVASVSRPTAVEQLPNDRIAVLEQHTGRVRLIDTASGSLLPFAALDLAVCQGNEQGLLGFTEDPNFMVTGRIYVYYTTPAGGCRNRVSAFTMQGDGVVPGSEQVLIEITTAASNHNGGDLEVGNDGFLYVAVGDGGRDIRGGGSAGGNNAAQDRSILNGKVLRLNRFTGAPAPGNPFDGEPGARVCGSAGTATPVGAVCREIFAFGLRNPYRFAFDPNTSATRFFVNDVGQGTQEEVDEAGPGLNYGWNAREGNCNQGRTTGSSCDNPPFGLVDPITSYPRSRGTYITAGAFVPDGAWPEEYDGGYFFGDGGSGRVWFLDATGDVDYDDPFLTSKFGLADMAFVLEADGWALYYTLNGSGQVRKVTRSFVPSSPTGPLVFDRLDVTDRAFDSRTTSPPARIRGGRTRLISLGPDALGARAALVNITLVDPTGVEFATVWQPRSRRPSTSNLNALPFEVVANASIVPVDSEGRLLFYTRSTTDVIVDVAGYFRDAPGPTAAGRYESLDPERLTDSRKPPGPGNEHSRAPSGPGELVNVPVAGRAGVPVVGVDSVVLILSGIAGPGPGNGWLAAFDGGGTRPPSSNLNVNPDFDVRVNTAVVPLGADGSIDVFLFNMDDVIVEVVGWFTDDSATPSTAGRFRLLNPTREADTRGPIGFGPLADGESATLNPSSVPDSAAAVAHNLTFAPTGGWGFVTASPDLPPPLVSNLNGVARGQIRAALAITPLGAGGSVSFTGESPVTKLPHQLVVDVFGYFE